MCNICGYSWTYEADAVRASTSFSLSRKAVIKVAQLALVVAALIGVVILWNVSGLDEILGPRIREVHSTLED